MLCSKCGKKISKKEKFCPLCGSEIEKNNRFTPLFKNFLKSKKKDKAIIAEISASNSKKKHRIPAKIYFLLACIVVGVLCIGIGINSLLNAAYSDNIKIAESNPILYLAENMQLKYVDADNNIVTIDENVTGFSTAYSLDNTFCFIITNNNLHMIQNAKSYIKLSQDVINNVIAPKSGSYIAYTIEANEGTSLYHMNVETCESQLVTKNAGEFTLSPDGTILCYYDTSEKLLYKKSFGKKAVSLYENTADEKISVISISTDGNTVAYYLNDNFYIQEKSETYYISNDVKNIVTDYNNANFYIFCSGDLLIKNSKKTTVRIEGGEDSLPLSTLKPYAAAAFTSSKKADIYTLLSIMPREFTYLYSGKIYYCDNKSSTLVSSLDYKSILLSEDNSTLFYIDSGNNLYSAKLSKGKISQTKRIASGVAGILQAEENRVVYIGNDDNAYLGKHKSAKPTELGKLSVSLLSQDAKQLLYIDGDENLMLLPIGKKTVPIDSEVSGFWVNSWQESLSDIYYIKSGTLYAYTNKVSVELDTEVNLLN